MDRWDIEKKIVIRALRDPTFKKQLLSSPKEAICALLKDEKGIDFSLFDKLNVKTVEEKQNEWMIALPNVPENLKALSGAELEKLFAAVDHPDFPEIVQL
jgi:hypothetical protein